MDCIRVTHPCAGRRQRYCYLPAAPRLACVRPVASVHPEPGSNSSLYFLYSLLYLRSVTWPNWLLSLLFPVLHLLLQFLQWTWQKFPGACPVSSFAVAKLMHFPTPLQIFLNVFLNYFSMKWKLFLFQIVIAKIFLPLHRTIKVIWNANAISRL